MKFTIEEIRAYLLSQDSFGDVLYNLNEANIIEANKPPEADPDDEDEDDKCWNDLAKYWNDLANSHGNK
jgi:hypothetical protein